MQGHMDILYQEGMVQQKMCCTQLENDNRVEVPTLLAHFFVCYAIILSINPAFGIVYSK